MPTTLTHFASFDLPSVRDLFLPDPGYTMFDIDLAGADAQVVAWEAEDDDLKAAFRAGLKVHAHNAVALEPKFGDYNAFNAKRNPSSPLFDPAALQLYDDVKRAVHGTNYGASAATIAQTLGWSTAHAQAFQRRWFALHPGILEWHRSIERSLQSERRVRNRFGYHRIFFDRIDGVFPEALAWGPQSTVALVAARADHALTTHFRGAPGTGSIMLQVHDSLVGQVRTSRLASTLRAVHDIIHAISVPYPDPLIIPWGLKISERSWGHCREAKWADFIS